MGKLASLIKAKERFSSIISEFYHLIKAGWPLYWAMWNLIWWLSWYAGARKVNIIAEERKQSFLEKYINENYSEIVKKYTCSKESENECTNFRIWIFWGQGETDMPSLVRACYKKLKENNKNVQFIDMNNTKQFVVLPQVVYDKLKKGELLFAHFSDILRNTLIAQYGGLWLDATVWFPNKMPDIATSSTFFSPHNTDDNTFWCSYAMGSNKINSVTFSFVRDILTAVCEKEGKWPCYLFQDHVLKFAHKHIPAAKKAIDETPTNNTRRFMLFHLINKPYNEKEYSELISNNFIFKLSYKSLYKLEYEGRETFYSHLIANNDTPKA